ncbi:nucleotidyltransferase domain-containing protein [Actinokineospora fastidiosa]|uniref:Nucleotidyltransferase n=1 Tax=Actinokineospora fastidiosa TaxID=1816 RepID=A0A918G1I3_9PSEU|nr:nucleotidyltransferase domain-containing protein [Actinokineospora fastidiosa]GGS14052.1 nucleotidyltransferase [Actinokineospora fastidiosa]
MTTILLTVIGSRAYGLVGPESDVDLRGVFVAPTTAFWRFAKPPTSVEGPEPERLDWEVEHFCALALKSNPTVLEVLASPLIRVCTPVGAELRALLPAFLCRQAAATFTHTCRRQLDRALAPERPKHKQIMHVIRLGQTALRLLRTGELSIAAQDRAALLAVRDGETPLAESVAWAERVLADLAAAVPDSPLPETPDTARVQDWLISVRRRFLDDADPA